MKYIIRVLYFLALLPFVAFGTEPNTCEDILKLEKKDLAVTYKFEATLEQIQQAQSAAYLAHLRKQFTCLTKEGADLNGQQQTLLQSVMEEIAQLNSPNPTWVNGQSCAIIADPVRDQNFVKNQLQTGKASGNDQAGKNLNVTKLIREIDCLHGKSKLTAAQKDRLKEASSELYLVKNPKATPTKWVEDGTCALVEDQKRDNDFMTKRTADINDTEEIKVSKDKLQSYKLTQQIECLEAKSELKDEQKLLLADSSKQLYELKHPQLKQEEVVSTGRIISSFELGLMRLPDYADGENNGFTDTRAYFDGTIDGRFEFEDAGMVVNTTFATSFYGGGGFKDDANTSDDGGTTTDDRGFPTSFDEVSDTIDANFSLRLSSYKCYWDDDDVNVILQALSCISASSDGKSSLGLIARYGFENKDVRTDEQDTVNDYFGWGLEYRSYRDKIQPGTNRIPDFVVSYVRSEYEEYGLIKSMPDCDVKVDGCLIPHEDATRHIVKLSYRLVDDKPFFLGFRLNGGRGPDEYGLTLGIRKSAYDILGFFGVKDL